MEEVIMEKGWSSYTDWQDLHELMMKRTEQAKKQQAADN
jgi:hypothetical protein